MSHLDVKLVYNRIKAKPAMADDKETCDVKATDDRVQIETNKWDNTDGALGDRVYNFNQITWEKSEPNTIRISTKDPRGFDHVIKIMPDGTIKQE